MIMIDGIISKVKGWWYKLFDYNKIVSDFGLDMQTSKDVLDAIQEWNKISVSYTHLRAHET